MRWLIAAIFGNLGKVSDGVWRSAQRWYLYPIWACLGLKTIINLSTHKPEAQDSFERWFCRVLDIELVEFDNLGPEYRFNEAYIELLESEKPVLAHCEGGRDRTGGLMAVYKREQLRQTYTDIVEDWPVYGTPGENWLMFLFRRWE